MKKIMGYQAIKRIFYLHISDIFCIFVSMNEQVADILQVLKRQSSEMTSMREGMDALRTENANLLHLKDNFERLRKGLCKCRDYIFNFLENPSIPSDNNASERGIRKLKIKQKISGTFRSDNGADAFFAIHSIADSAWKNKQSQLNAINTILSL